MAANQLGGILFDFAFDLHERGMIPEASMASAPEEVSLAHDKNYVE